MKLEGRSVLEESVRGGLLIHVYGRSGVCNRSMTKV